MDRKILTDSHKEAGSLLNKAVILLTRVLGTQKNLLTETGLLRTHNICFG